MIGSRAELVVSQRLNLNPQTRTSSLNYPDFNTEVLGHVTTAAAEGGGGGVGSG